MTYINFQEFHKVKVPKAGSSETTGRVKYIVLFLEGLNGRTQLSVGS